MTIHISRDGKEIGMFTLEKLHQAVADRVVRVDDLAWMDGMTEWEPLSQVADVSTPSAAPSLSWKLMLGGFAALTVFSAWYVNQNSKLDPLQPASATPPISSPIMSTGGATTTDASDLSSIPDNSASLHHANPTISKQDPLPPASPIPPGPTEQNPVPPASPIPPKPTQPDYRILGHTIATLTERYGSPSTEKPIPKVPGGKTLIFDDAPYRIAATFLDGKAVQIIIGSQEEIPQNTLGEILQANSEDAKFVRLSPDKGMIWERDDKKVSAFYSQASTGYLFAIVSNELKKIIEGPSGDESNSVDAPSVLEWREKAKSVMGAQLAGLLGTSRVPIQNGEAFFAAVGKPAVEGQEGKYAVFSWKCRDGVIVIMANAQIWQAQKMLIVEDFQQSFVEGASSETAEAKLTVAEWREKAKSVIGAQLAGLLGTSRVPIQNGEAFFAAVGKPAVEGQEGKYAVFSWKCRDGVIVIMANAQIWQAQKMLIVEDFSYESAQ